MDSASPAVWGARREIEEVARGDLVACFRRSRIFGEHLQLSAILWYNTFIS